MNGLLGFKKEQFQQFTAEGKRIPVTTIQAGPCWITKVEEMPTYKSIQIGFGNTRHVSKAEEGHTKKAGLTDKLRFLRTFRVSTVGDVSDVSLGAEVKVGDVFSVGDAITVTGMSKGKGFASAIKRHNFSGGPRTHGQSDRERAPGSIGSGTTPGRVQRGKRMAGHMGAARATVNGLRVVAIDQATNIMTVKGLVPGGRKGLLIIQKEI
ncbi:MAG: 50S ribosomal protein L3 [Patescibacteria group bacterium]